MLKKYMRANNMKIKKGMSKDDVNKIIKSFLTLEDDIYCGNDYKHNWRCLCGNKIEGRVWDTIFHNNCYRCKDCVIKYNRSKKNNKCIICSKEEILANNMCIKHYAQFNKFGRCLDNSPRTVQDPNEIIIYNDYAEVILYKKDGFTEICRVIIDLDDVDKVSKYKWYLTSEGYAIHKSKQTLYMHRYVMNYDGDLTIDHINTNKIDNRKSNLRIATYSENNVNIGLRSNNTSGYTGVNWISNANKWNARISINNNEINLGYYDEKENAIKARKEAEIKYFGEFAYVGFES